jgi:hypothetical protein
MCVGVKDEKLELKQSSSILIKGYGLIISAAFWLLNKVLYATQSTIELNLKELLERGVRIFPRGRSYTCLLTASNADAALDILFLTLSSL